MPNDFLGRGWSFPVRLDASGHIALSEYEEDIREAIRIVLLTARGERVMRPDFGAGLQEFVFDTMSLTTLGSIEAAVRDALAQWEPRIQVQDVQVKADPGDVGKLLIRVAWKVRATNNRFNLVFPFFLQQGGAP